ncbi:unnamed protein product [Orchesella dallaii]|uniref:Uncharacterized protein n=1 Tax=Orchesella dallaii TaxID=48710 RepID=A0ABP1S0P0_9HEXA
MSGRRKRNPAEEQGKSSTDEGEAQRPGSPAVLTNSPSPDLSPIKRATVVVTRVLPPLEYSDSEQEETDVEDPGPDCPPDDGANVRVMRAYTSCRLRRQERHDGGIQECFDVGCPHVSTEDPQSKDNGEQPGDDKKKMNPSFIKCPGSHAKAVLKQIFMRLCKRFYKKKNPMEQICPNQKFVEGWREFYIDDGFTYYHRKTGIMARAYASREVIFIRFCQLKPDIASKEYTKYLQKKNGQDLQELDDMEVEFLENEGFPESEANFINIKIGELYTLADDFESCYLEWKYIMEGRKKRLADQEEDPEEEEVK